MKIKSKIYILLLLIIQFSFAQKKKENIGTEEVNVVKPFSPTISDAFKLKEIPAVEDEGNTKKETTKYTILYFPVASIFTPSKGKAEGVEKEKQAHLYNNYATFGAGNYGTLNAELFVIQDLNNNDYIGGTLRHLSSQGGIKGAELKDSFYDTSANLTYGVRERDLSWNVDLGYQNQIYNWYGLPDGFGSSLSANNRISLIQGINPQQTYNKIHFDGKIEFDESILKETSVLFHHFSDAYGSSENRFYAKPSLNLDVLEQSIKANIIVDYLGGSFKQGYWTPNAIQYGTTNFGITPSLVMQEDDWTVNLGVGLFYSLASNTGKNNFYIYPQITASYKVVGDLMIFYTGAKGNLEQNSYSDFVDKNPFVSPTLDIKPTSKLYDVFAGLKGKLTDNVSYNIKASLVNEKDKALFKSNDYNEINPKNNYAYGNSLQVVYDDLKTLSFYGELKADISNAVSFGIDGTFSSYTKTLQDEVWNLPTLKLNAKADFNITERWYAGANLFFVGDRKDQEINTSIIYLTQPSATTLKSYFDVNAHLGFKYSERLTAFLRANNITNQAYQKWLNYPVQGFQVVLGANFKFDF